MISSLIVLAALALVALLAGLWVLTRARWFTGFFYGLLGIILLAGAVAGGLGALELVRYSALPGEEILGTVTVSTTDAEDEYQITFNRVSGTERYLVAGDTWSLAALQANVPALILFGEGRGWYRLEGATGRFRLTRDELAAPTVRTAMPWHRQAGDHVVRALFKPATIRTPHIPLAGNAIYTVRLERDSLSLEPVNDEARATLTDG